MKILSILLCLITFSFSIIEHASSVTHACQVFQLESAHLDETAGHLIYVLNGSSGLITSEPEGIGPIEIEGLYRIARISPNEQWVAWLQMDRATSKLILKVQSLFDSRAYAVEIDEQDVNNFYWLNNQEILTVLIPHGTWPPNYYPERILDPFAGNQRSVLPVSIVTNPEVTNPFFPGRDFGELFEVSPDGQYSVVFAYDGSILLYNTVNQSQIGILDNVVIETNIAWSNETSEFVFYGHTQNEDQNRNNAYIYDIPNNTLSFLTDFNFSDDTNLTLQSGSWSGDKRYLALGLETEILGKYDLVIWDTYLNKGDKTCLTNFVDDNVVAEFDFAWSKDSRYLALYGLVRTQDRDQDGSIFIMDVNTLNIFEVYHKKADILEWVTLDSE